MERPLARLALVTLLAFIAACGGSGGGDDRDASPVDVANEDPPCSGPWCQADGPHGDASPSDGPRPDSGTPVVPDGHRASTSIRVSSRG